jgi:hypothetical protein
MYVSFRFPGDVLPRAATQLLTSANRKLQNIDSGEASILQMSPPRLEEFNGSTERLSWTSGCNSSRIRSWSNIFAKYHLDMTDSLPA